MDRALLGVALIPLIPLIIASFMVKERAGEDKVNFRRLSRGSVVVIEGRRPSTSEATISLLKTVAQKRFLVLSGALFFVYGGFLLPFNYVPMFAEFNGYGNMSDILLAICYSGSFVGRISTGALADRFGR